MVSVIVPVYNAGQFLGACIESILGQTFTDIELIIVNDGSTDDSGEIAERYASKDERIKVIHKENGGQASARNRGLEASAGNLIAFVDADDLLFSDSIATLRELLANTDADIAEGAFVYGTDLPASRRETGRIKIFTGEGAAENVMYQHTLLPSVCGKLFRRSLFTNLRFEEGIYYEDLDLSYQLYLKCGKVAYTSKQVYFYRTNEHSFIHTWDKRRKDVLYVTRKMEKAVEGNSRLEAASLDRRLSANFNMFILASQHGEDELAARCWKVVRSYRKYSLKNPRVRLKSRLGCALSYFGQDFFLKFSRLIYK